MSSFKGEEVLQSPDLDTFGSLRKIDLLALGRHLGLSLVSQAIISEITTLVAEKVFTSVRADLCW